VPWLSLALTALVTSAPPVGKPPVLALHELRVTMPGEADRPGPPVSPVRKRVRFATPKGWTGEEDDTPDFRSMRLSGPEGVGEMLIVAATHPSELGEYLTQLKNDHPAAAPSPPMAIDVAGIDIKKGERATRFQITGREVGEMVMVERGGVIVLFATIVDPDAWPELSKLMQRCYPTVEVMTLEPPKK
jgi:hypothetical protein